MENVINPEKLEEICRQLNFPKSRLWNAIASLLQKDAEFSKTFLDAAKKVLASDLATYLVKEAQKIDGIDILSSDDLKSAVIFLRCCKGYSDIVWKKIVSEVPWADQFIKLPQEFRFTEGDIEFIFSKLPSEKKYEALMSILDRMSDLGSKFVLSQMADFEPEQQAAVLKKIIDTAVRIDFAAVLPAIFKLPEENQKVLIESSVWLKSNSFTSDDIERLINLPYAGDLLFIFAKRGHKFNDKTLEKCFEFDNAEDILSAYVTTVSYHDGVGGTYQVLRPLKPEHLEKVLKLGRAKEILMACLKNQVDERNPYQKFGAAVIDALIKRTNGESE